MGGSFGAYGKMPALGDFFRIRADAAFVREWDGWLQGILNESKSAFGTRWDDLYMSAPIWRFTLSAGVAGPRPVLGVLMASVDRVGRTFPLTLMAPVAGDAIVLHAAAGPVFDRLENIALSALGDDMTREKLSGALEEIPLTTGPPDQDVLRLATHTAARPSVWSALTKDGISAHLFDGLPQGRRSKVLLDPAPAAQRALI